jgi:Bacteriophage related domain of unknown function
MADPTSIWRPVRADLRRILMSVPGLPGDGKWEGKRFKPSDGLPWFTERIEFAGTTTETLGFVGQVQENAIYQIELYWPANGAVSDCDDLADRIRQTFWHGRGIGGSGPAQISGAVLSSTRLRSVEMDQFYQIPVRVEFYVRRFIRQGVPGFVAGYARGRAQAAV